MNVVKLHQRIIAFDFVSLAAGNSGTEVDLVENPPRNGASA